MAVILIVEDDPLILDIAALIVEDLGHNTLSSNELSDALSILRSRQHIDALFTDIRLQSSVLGGFELASEAIKLRPDLRVLYTTGSDASGKMTGLFVKDGQFLEKPYTPYQLQHSIEAMLA